MRTRELSKERERTTEINREKEMEKKMKKQMEREKEREKDEERDGVRSSVMYAVRPLDDEAPHFTPQNCATLCNHFDVIRKQKFKCVRDPILTCVCVMLIK